MLIVSLVIFQILFFFGLVVFFKRIFTKNVATATMHLDDMNQEYEKKEREVTRRLEEAQQKAEDIMHKALAEAEKEKVKIIKEAEDARENLLKQARSQSGGIVEHAEKSRKLILSEIDKRIKKEAIAKACDLIQHTLPEEFKMDVHSRWVSDLIGGGFQGLENIKVAEGVSQLKVTSAFPLSEAEKSIISEKFKTLLGRDIDLKEEINPQIVAGIIIAIGSMVMDGSFKNKIREQAQKMDAMGGEDE